MSYIAAKEESQRVLDAVEQYEREHRARTRARKKSEHVSVAMTEELAKKLGAYAGRKRKSISAAARELIEQGLKEE